MTDITNIIEMNFEWTDDDPVLIGSNVDNLPPKIRVLMFDLDGTIINPDQKVRKGAPYTKWKFFPGAKNRLQKEATSTTLIVIVTNQLRLHDYKDAFKTKIEEIVKDLNISILFYAASKYNVYRKPNTGIISNYLLPFLQKKGVKQIVEYIYVGDAAGRKGDFSDSDRKFLINTQLFFKSKENTMPSSTPVFYTPDEYFLGKKPKSFKLTGFDPVKALNDVRRTNSKTLKKISEIDTSIDYLKLQPAGAQEVIMFVGPPASGKTHVAKRIVREWDNYKRANQDELKTKAKTLQTMNRYLNQGYSVVLDNTNPSPKKRAEYIELAQKYFAENDRPVHIRAFHMNGDWNKEKRWDFAKHMNNVRARSNEAKRIHPIVYRVYCKHFAPPTEEEGFTQIINVKFLPRFANPTRLLEFLQRT